MSLRVWLPLRGDLCNQGLADITVTNSGATVNANGKIGQCYYFDGTDDFIKLEGVELSQIFSGGTQPFSICMWVYNGETSANRAILFGNYTVSPATSSMFFNIELMSGSNQVRFDWKASPDWNAGATTVIPTETWTHVCCSYDGNNVYVYINGTKQATRAGALSTLNLTNAVYYLGRDARTGATAFLGRMNDVRIYDHALSDKEVEEIAKGLVVHYKLDGTTGAGNPNILTGTYYNSYMASAAIRTTARNIDGKWAGGSGGNGKFAVVEDNTCPIGIYSWSITNNTRGNRDFQQGDQPFVSGQKYTTSFWAKGSGTCLYRSWNSTDGKQMFQKTWTLTSDWTYYTYTFTASAEMESDACSFHLGVTGASSISICGMKMELGDIATPYTTATDELIDSTIIYDSSGYENNGTITGTLTTDDDTPRYALSTVFNGSSYITTAASTFQWYDFSEGTLCAWMKPTASMTGWAGSVGVVADTNQNYKGWSITDYANSFRIAYSNTAYTTVASGKTLPLNEWHFCVATLSGTTLKMYYDGVLVNTSTIDWKTATIATGLRFQVGVDLPGSDEKFMGQYSDVRFYTTVLTDAQILELYNTSASIDKKGNVYSRELVEI